MKINTAPMPDPNALQNAHANTLSNTLPIAPLTESAPEPAELPTEHHARYLVLFGDDEAPRAALFDTHERLLAEMIEADGYIVANLVRASSACAPPRPAMVDAIEALDADADLARARCFRLG